MKPLRMGVAGLVALSTAILAAQQAPPPPPQGQTPQQQAPVFRGKSETVAVPVTVFDESRELVTNLTREDFKIFDEGQVQETTNFISGLQPISSIVLVDTSASMATAVERARVAAEQFLIRLRPGDQARVGTFDDKVILSPEFTGDRDALLRALRLNDRYANPTRLFDALMESIEALSPLGGRRVIVAITDGCDTGSKTPWDTLRRRFMTEDMMIYIVRMRGRIIMRNPQRVRPLVDCDIHADLELQAGTPMRDFFNINDARRSLSSMQFMDRMSSETGGGFVFLRDDDDLGVTFTRISNELHYLYLLGFTPQKLDGKTHEITVKLKDPSMFVRARRSYLAPGPDVKKLP